MADNAKSHLVGPLVGTAWTAVGSILAIVFGLCSAVVVTRYLGPTAFGQYAYLTWLGEAGGAVASLGLARPIARFAARLQREGATANLQRLARSAALLGAVTAAVLGGSAGLLTGGAMGAELASVFLAFAFAASTASSVILIAALQGSFRLREAAVVGLCGPALLLLGSLLVAATGGSVAHQFLVATSAVGCSALLGLQILGRPKGTGTAAGITLRTRNFTRYWRLAAALVVVEVVIWQRSEVWFLQRYRSPEDVAFYTAAFGIASRAVMAASFVAPALYSTAASLIYSRADEARVLRRTYTLSTRWLAMVCVPMLLIGAGMAGELLQFLFGSAYSQAAVPLSIMLVAGIASALSVGGSAVMYGTDRMPFILTWGLVAAAATLLSNYLLVPNLGATGAALGNSSGQVLAITVTYWLGLRPVGFQIPWMSLGKIAACSLIACGIGAAIAAALPPGPALLFGVPAAAMAYLLLLRVLRGFDVSDAQLLGALGSVLPAPLSRFPGFLAHILGISPQDS